ncbi:hypothetical protein NDU88_004023 [Pleurodeles waltl]|uniref:Uncharacterized protein n=1 Tax=Pleurodeles waltl TaxID=8319 RepID=A0AAV7V074_PLEWA|nr:hypothetical protein NDU88_004023 [Pleurodeles waltl]
MCFWAPAGTLLGDCLGYNARITSDLPTTSGARLVISNLAMFDGSFPFYQQTFRFVAFGKSLVSLEWQISLDEVPATILETVVDGDRDSALDVIDPDVNCGRSDIDGGVLNVGRGNPDVSEYGFDADDYVHRVKSWAVRATFCECLPGDTAGTSLLGGQKRPGLPASPVEAATLDHQKARIPRAGGSLPAAGSRRECQPLGGGHFRPPTTNEWHLAAAREGSRCRGVRAHARREAEIPLTRRLTRCVCVTQRRDCAINTRS